MQTILRQLSSRMTSVRRHGFMGPLVSGAVALLVVTIVVAVSVTLLANFKGTSTNSDANTTIDNGITSVKTFSQNLNTLALVIIFGIIIGVVLLYFGGLAGGRRGS